MKSQFELTWVDSGHEPQCPPNPDYPDGIDVDLASPHQGCKVDLPYPARRCGFHKIVCKLCGGAYLVTTAGRPDDPRSALVPCASMIGRA